MSGKTTPGWVQLIIWLSIFYLVYLLFDKLIGLQFNPNQQVFSQQNSQGVVEVVLTRNREGHYVMTGLINQQPVTFLLDTGATDVAVPQTLAEQLQLPKLQAQTYHTANGITHGYQTRIPNIAIGQIQLNDIRGGIVPNMHGDYILLGMSFLKHLEFTQRGDTLILRMLPPAP